MLSIITTKQTMDTVKTITVNAPVPPIAPKRSLIKVTNKPSRIEIRSNCNSSIIGFETCDQQEGSCVKITEHSESNITTNQPPIKFVFGTKQQQTGRQSLVEFDADSYLFGLVEEYQTLLDKKDCESINCHRFRLISFRITQALFDKKGGKFSVQGTNNPKTEESSSASSTTPIESTYISSMEKNNLFSLINEKDKRIEDLERLVEDQRRLRLQDASQVEEKAAKIKDWVANKLKELESQNKQLRDQNKRQKEVVETLSNQIATMSPISMPRRGIPVPESAQFIDQHDNDQVIRVIVPARQVSKGSSLDIVSNRDNRKHGLTPKCASPIYDSVGVEYLNKTCNSQTGTLQVRLEQEQQPPPRPLHLSDRWEKQLYSLADRSFSTITSREDDNRDSSSQLDENESSSDKDASLSRKSSSSAKNDLQAIVNPQFTTIDGDRVVDIDGSSSLEQSSQHAMVNYDTSPPNSRLVHASPYLCRKTASKSSFELDNSPAATVSLFDSPMRTRNGKDSLLRTQSVRKSPAPDKLYDFIAADLVKRSYLFKPGAIKNHQRWFVLKNFHLYSYKSESDETSKACPNLAIKLTPSTQILTQAATSDNSYPLKLIVQDKIIHMIAETAQLRDDWCRMLTVAINLCDIEPLSVIKNRSTYAGPMSITRHGHTKRCHAMLIGHVVFFLRSLTDPTIMSYVSVKGSKIREITDNQDYDIDELDSIKSRQNCQDCSLAIYPRYSVNLDPIYITLGNQQETDKWFYFLSSASDNDQFFGTQFERTLTKLMIKESFGSQKYQLQTDSNRDPDCPWAEHTVILYNNGPITHPLTSMPNETLKMEAVELSKSILLFTQVPIEQTAIDYHVCLLQNCLGRFLKLAELRNEFYAQLIKQCTFVQHKCNKSRNPAPSTMDDDCMMATVMRRTSGPGDCRLVTDVETLRSMVQVLSINKLDANSNILNYPSQPIKSDYPDQDPIPSSQSELLQVMQIFAIAVSMNVPRGRLRCWLINHLTKFANQETSVGKYASYTLKAIERTIKNGPRDNVPSRTEIVSILLRNPYDHSSPHSLPVSFSDGTYIVLEVDGSTTVEEFMDSLIAKTCIRHSCYSDFYLFSDDPAGSKELHILEPQRKVLDIVSWWDQTFRKHNSGRLHNTKIIKLLCKKRLLFRTEQGETQQERLLITHQMNQELIVQSIPLEDDFLLELASIMTQLCFGDIQNSHDGEVLNCIMENVHKNFLPNKSSLNLDNNVNTQIISRWNKLAGRSAQDCVRVYLNCMRRLKLDNNNNTTLGDR